MRTTISELLTYQVTNTALSDEVAVLLSGGVDSISVAFAAERAGKKITAYSFQLDNNPSYDFQKAKEIAKIMKWDFVGIEIPTENLVEDFYKLVEFGCKKKTHFECVYPFLYVYPKIKETYVVSGWAADGYYGVSKKACMHFKEPKSKFDTFRDDYFKPENCAGYHQHLNLAIQHGKCFVTPYLSQNIKEFFYQFDWFELNKPYQKHTVRNSFVEFDLIGNVKKHLNLQLDSGIATLFETLLNNNKINFKQRKRMMEVYKDNIMVYNNNATLERFL